MMGGIWYYHLRMIPWNNFIVQLRNMLSICITVICEISLAIFLYGAYCVDLLLLIYSADAAGTYYLLRREAFA